MKEYYQATVARKYAEAYVRVFIDTLSVDDAQHIHNFADFFSENRRILFFFTLPALDEEIKRSGVSFLCERFNMPPSIEKLIVLMLHNKRIFLLEKVLYCINAMYKKQKNIESFAISCSHVLTQDSLDSIKRFLAQRTGSDIIYTYVVDENLIAGIRMQGDFHIWEHSIAQQLRSIQVLLMRKGNYGR